MSKRKNDSLPSPDPDIFAKRDSFIKKNRPNVTQSPGSMRCPSTPKVYRISNSSFTRKKESFQGQDSFTPINFTNAAIILCPMYNSKLKMAYFNQCFETIEKLGEGSFGEVFQVRSKYNGQIYAIKVTKECLKFGRKNKINEVRNNQKVPYSPYCIQFHSAWEENDHLYMQLEYCETSLDKFVLMNSVTEKQLWEILLDCVLGLKNIHDKEMIHRDIKPGNIMRSSNGICKIGDFGLLYDKNETEEMQNFSSGEGDAKYLAPEAMEGPISPAIDIFSLGITMLELASNYNLPGNGPNWISLRNETIPDELQKEIPPELLKIISWMLKQNPSERPTVDQLLEVPFLNKLYNERKKDELLWKQNEISEESTSSKMKQNLPLVVINSPETSSEVRNLEFSMSNMEFSATESEADDFLDPRMLFNSVPQSTPYNPRRGSDPSTSEISHLRRVNLFGPFEDENVDQ